MKILKVLSFIALVAASYGAAIPEQTDAAPANAGNSTNAPAAQGAAGAPGAPGGPDSNQVELKLVNGPVSCDYKTNDTNAELNSDNKISCKGNTCTAAGSGVTAAEGLVTISAAGNYVLEGDFQGQVLIQATKEDFVHLILNNASISSNNGPCINAQLADKVTITLAGNNKLTDSVNYTGKEKEPDACLYSKADLSINGSGNLEVTGNYADGIRTTKDMKLVSGTINVNAKGRGIKAKNSICVKEATINVDSTDSALKVTRKDKEDKGYITIDDGKLTISTENDAIHAETHFTNRNGNIDVKKCKEGIEAQMIDILGGEIHINATDDGINAVKVGKAAEGMMPPDGMGGMGGSAPPDGMGGMAGSPPPDGNGMGGSPPPDGNAGSPDGGNFSTDNPPPKPNDPHANDGSIYVNIVGGKVYIDVTDKECDGIDSNGISYIGGDAEVYISINGGEIYGPIGVIDAEGANSVVAGATFVGIAGDMDWDALQLPGSTGNTAVNNNANNATDATDAKPATDATEAKPAADANDSKPAADAKDAAGAEEATKKQKRNGEQAESAKVYQPRITVELPLQKAGTQFTVKDKENNVIVSHTPGNDFSHILISSPKMVADESYTLTAGDFTQSFVALKADEGTAKSPSVTSDGFKSIPFNMVSILIFTVLVILF